MKSLANTIILALVSLVFCGGAWAGSLGDAVEVRIVSDSGRELPLYPVKARHPAHKAYAEARKGEHYRIVVQNRLNRRVGVVVAVDGRNIISGGQSWLKPTERMYILDPYGSGEYSGWRTGDDRVNRFYFTDVADSYAGAFNDTSAMGVIAVAVFPEKELPPPVLSQRVYENRAAAPASAPARAKEQAADRQAKAESAGTGYGHEEYSPVRVVAFDPEPRARETIYLKYEWRSTLQRLGILKQPPRPQQPPNRLWDNGGYAPPPPGRS